MNGVKLKIYKRLPDLPTECEYYPLKKGDEILIFLSPFTGNNLISVTAISEGLIDNAIEIIIKVPVPG